MQTDLLTTAYPLTWNIGSTRIPADTPLHLDHAYATTAHSAQGMTCDRVFYNAESFSRTTAQDTYYVSISRERHSVTVFTDDARTLPKAIYRVPHKGLAHDLMSTAKFVPGLEVEMLKPASARTMEIG